MSTMLQMITARTPTWMYEQGVKCSGDNMTDLFYPTQLSSEVTRAKNICNGMDGAPACPFRDKCLKYAIDFGEGYGVWGGTSERDRRKIQRARRKYMNPRIYSMEDVKFPHAVIIQMRPSIFIKRRTTEQLRRAA